MDELHAQAHMREGRRKEDVVVGKKEPGRDQTLR